MITDGQVYELRGWLGQGRSLKDSARMASMDKKTACSYRDDERLPSQRKSGREYRTRVDPFESVWFDVQRKLEAEPRLNAKTLFEDFRQTHAGQFPDSTRRTFERRVATWRSLSGSNQTVMFLRDHHPGSLAARDFTVCNQLGVKIAGIRFDHTLFHCVLTYSNFESVSLCFSESFEALSEGIQNAFEKFGGVSTTHRTDSFSVAVNNHSERTLHTKRYAGLMDYRQCEPQRTNVRCVNENGDVESSNGHTKDRIDQALLLRGSRDFVTLQEYMQFVQTVVDRANGNRKQKFLDEQQTLQPLPSIRLESDDILLGIQLVGGNSYCRSRGEVIVAEQMVVIGLAPYFLLTSLSIPFSVYSP